LISKQPTNSLYERNNPSQNFYDYSSIYSYGTENKIKRTPDKLKNKELKDDDINDFINEASECIKNHLNESETGKFNDLDKKNSNYSYGKNENNHLLKNTKTEKQKESYIKINNIERGINKIIKSDDSYLLKMRQDKILKKKMDVDNTLEEIKNNLNNLSLKIKTNDFRNTTPNNNIINNNNQIMNKNILTSKINIESSDDDYTNNKNNFSGKKNYINKNNPYNNYKNNYILNDETENNSQLIGNNINRSYSSQDSIDYREDKTKQLFEKKFGNSNFLKNKNNKFSSNTNANFYTANQDDKDKYYSKILTIKNKSDFSNNISANNFHPSEKYSNKKRKNSKNYLNIKEKNIIESGNNNLIENLNNSITLLKQKNKSKYKNYNDYASYQDFNKRKSHDKNLNVDENRFNEINYSIKNNANSGEGKKSNKEATENINFKKNKTNNKNSNSVNALHDLDLDKDNLMRMNYIVDNLNETSNLDKVLKQRKNFNSVNNLKLEELKEKNNSIEKEIEIIQKNFREIKDLGKEKKKEKPRNNDQNKLEAVDKQKNQLYNTINPEQFAKLKRSKNSAILGSNQKEVKYKTIENYQSESDDEVIRERRDHGSINMNNKEVLYENNSFSDNENTYYVNSAKKERKNKSLNFVGNNTNITNNTNNMNNNQENDKCKDKENYKFYFVKKNIENASKDKNNNNDNNTNRYINNKNESIPDSYFNNINDKNNKTKDISKSGRIVSSKLDKKEKSFNNKVNKLNLSTNKSQEKFKHENEMKTSHNFKNPHTTNENLMNQPLIENLNNNNNNNNFEFNNTLNPKKDNIYQDKIISLLEKKIEDYEEKIFSYKSLLNEYLPEDISSELYSIINSYLNRKDRWFLIKRNVIKEIEHNLFWVRESELINLGFNINFNLFKNDNFDLCLIANNFHNLKVESKKIISEIEDMKIFINKELHQKEVLLKEKVYEIEKVIKINFIYSK